MRFLSVIISNLQISFFLSLFHVSFLTQTEVLGMEHMEKIFFQSERTSERERAGERFVSHVFVMHYQVKALPLSATNTHLLLSMETGRTGREGAGHRNREKEREREGMQERDKQLLSTSIALC